MKITKLGFLIILTTFLFICGKAQEISQRPDNLPLKLTLKVEEGKLCVGKEFKILARMENVSKETQIIDERNLWRYINIKAEGKKPQYDEKKSPAENLNEMLKANRFTVVFGDNFPDDDVPKEYLITLKPNDFYEDSITIKAGDKFFSKSDKYIYQMGYGQYADWSSKGVSLFIGKVDSNTIEFTLSDCKTN
jgi:hypothetical protein